MNMNKYAGGAYLKVDDVRDGALRKTIAKVKPGNYDKPDAHFTDGSILSLNNTNVKALIKAYGPDSNDWNLREVEAQLGRVKFRGEPTDSIVIVPISPALSGADLKAAQERVNASGDADMNDEIPF